MSPNGIARHPSSAPQTAGRTSVLKILLQKSAIGRARRGGTGVSKSHGCLRSGSSVGVDALALTHATLRNARGGRGVVQPQLRLRARHICFCRSRSPTIASLVGWEADHRALAENGWPCRRSLREYCRQVIIHACCPLLTRTSCSSRFLEDERATALNEWREREIVIDMTELEDA